MPNHGNNASGGSQGPQQGAPLGVQQAAPPGLQQAVPPLGVLPGGHFAHPGSGPPGGGHPGPHHGSNATLVQLPTIVATTIPLPQQRSSRAPYFKGRDVEDFIINIEAIGKAAAFSELELPGIVLRYCSSKVKHTLEHDASYFVTGNSWTDAKAILMYYYAKSDEVNTTADSLRRFGQKSRKISNKKAFDRYMQEFSRKRGKLVEKNLIAEGECDKLFYKGLPPALRRRIKPTLAALGDAERKPLSGLHPPPFRRTVDVVRKLFSADDIDYSSEGEVSSSSSDDGKLRKKDKHNDKSSGSDHSDTSNSSSGSDDDHSSRRGRSRKSKKKSKAAKSLKRQVEEKNSKISQLEERIKNMSVTQEPTQTFSVAYAEPNNQYGSSYPDPANQYLSAYAPAPQYRQQQFQSQQSQLPKSCFMCGKILGVDLDHSFPVKNCLELPGLIDDRILRFHPATGRLVKVSDNTELILTHRGPGGMAAALRREVSGQRDPPPHIASASCMAISLCRNNESVLKGDVHGASSHSFYSFPVTTRSQKARVGEDIPEPSPPNLQRKVHFRDHRDATDPPGNGRPAVHHSANDDLRFTHSEDQPREYASAPHKSNTREGWGEKQRSQQVDRRVDQKEKDKSLPYRFTSDIQTDVSGDDVLKRVLEQKTSISLKELLGISPDLQKRLGLMVKTRREFNAQTGEVTEPISHVSVDGDDALIEVASLSDNDPGCAILTWEGDPADLPNFVERYANAVSLRSPSKFYAKATGMVKGIFGGEEVTFLIDSGSELNLITRRVWEQTKVPIDEDGSRWSLKGLGGAPIPLIGCARDAPVQIEGKNFDHHFFVSTQEHGRYDGILGQPWLHWFSADIRYDRLGPTYLQAFPSGDKAGAFISVAITSIADPRNADKLLLTGDAACCDSTGF